jgi:hypothetical protein
MGLWTCNMEHRRLTLNLQVNMGLWTYLDVTWSNFPFGNICALVNKLADKVNGRQTREAKVGVQERCKFRNKLFQKVNLTINGK